MHIFQSYTSRGLLLAGKWVGQNDEILSVLTPYLPSCVVLTATLYSLVLVNDRCAIHPMTTERK